MAGRGKEFEGELKNSLRFFKDVEKNVMFSKNELLGGRFHFHEDLLPDFFVFTEEGKFFLLEAKKVQSKTSFNFGLIKKHQLRDLRRASKWPNGYGYVLINFRHSKKTARSERWSFTYAISINKFLRFKKDNDRSSIPVSYIKEHGVELKPRKYEVPKLKKDSEGLTKVNGWDLSPILFKEKK